MKNSYGTIGPQLWWPSQQLNSGPHIKWKPNPKPLWPSLSLSPLAASSPASSMPPLSFSPPPPPCALLPGDRPPPSPLLHADGGGSSCLLAWHRLSSTSPVTVAPSLFVRRHLPSPCSAASPSHRRRSWLPSLAARCRLSFPPSPRGAGFGEGTDLTRKRRPGGGRSSFFFFFLSGKQWRAKVRH